MSLNHWLNAVQYLDFALTAAVLATLALKRLAPTYRRLFLYLLADLAFSVGSLAIKPNTTDYAYYFFSAQAVEAILAAAVVLEIYSLALAEHAALARYGRNMVGYVFVAASLVAASGLLSVRSAQQAHDPALFRFLLFERTAEITLALFLILITAFIAWFPVKFRNNVIAYISGFVVLYLSRALSAEVAHLLPPNRKYFTLLSIVRISIFSACLVWWLVRIRKEGEVRTTIVGHAWNLGEAERLNAQLEAMNDRLARIGGK